MTAEWHEVTIAEFSPFSYGRGLAERDRSGGPIPVYGSNGVVGTHDVPLTDGPTVIIGRKGTVGAVHYSPGPCWPIDTTFYVTGRDEALVRFQYYALKSLGLEQMNADSAVPGLNREAAHARRLAIPDDEREQRAIVKILGTLDDKIELNERTIETLGAMPRALFRSWFVDFDPVRAKVEGRDPGLPPFLADLFPDAFETSELGEIPKGWEVKTLGELLELAYGKALKAEDRHDGTVPVYGSNGQVGWHDERLVAGPGIVVGRKGNPGIVTWVPKDFFPIDTTFYVVPNAACDNMPFLFHVLRTHDLASLGADSAVPGLNRNLAYMSRQVLPSTALRNWFDRLASEFLQRVHQINGESGSIAALRDTLLPRLISGVLRIENPVRFLGGGD